MHLFHTLSSRTEGRKADWHSFLMVQLSGRGASCWFAAPPSAKGPHMGASGWDGGLQPNPAQVMNHVPLAPLQYRHRHHHHCCCFHRLRSATSKLPTAVPSPKPPPLFPDPPLPSPRIHEARDAAQSIQSDLLLQQPGRPNSARGDPDHTFPNERERSAQEKRREQGMERR